MSRTIAVAAVQMDGQPAPTFERLARADRLVTAAAGAGAQLVVLPELFNTGYSYISSNYENSETLDGPSVSWMRESAARHGIHLAGSLLLLDGNEIYNALLVLAPDGRTWRYDKSYPAGWERAYFRPGQGVNVARTDLGDLGLLICWDSAHPDLWARYAGQVDMMVISSAPARVSDSIYILSNGRRLTHDKMGPLMRSVRGAADRIFGETIDRQTAWLGVPAVNAVACGRITTEIPNPRGGLLGLLPSAPWLIRHLPRADRMKMTFGFASSCKVVDPDGRVLVLRSQQEGEGFCLSEVTLADRRPVPRDPQPPVRIPATCYLLTDLFTPLQMIPYYQRGARQTWGEQMAPEGPAPVRWQETLAGIKATLSSLF